MANYIETKVRYQKTLDNGKVKKVTDTYIVDALSFTEAEAKTIDAVSAFIATEFTVSAVKKTNIAEIIGDGDGYEILNDTLFYRVKEDFISIDERTGAEKRVSCTRLVEASCLQAAIDNYLAYMKQSLANFDIVEVSKTPIIEVIMANK